MTLYSYQEQGEYRFICQVSVGVLEMVEERAFLPFMGTALNILRLVIFLVKILRLIIFLPQWAGFRFYRKRINFTDLRNVYMRELPLW